MRCLHVHIHIMLAPQTGTTIALADRILGRPRSANEGEQFVTPQYTTLIFQVFGRPSFMIVGALCHVWRIIDTDNRNVL